jgi:hypothetical protein
MDTGYLGYPAYGKVG